MSDLNLFNYEEESHKLLKKQLYILFGYFLLSGNLSIIYSAYNQGDIFLKILYYSIIIFVLALLSFLISITIKNKNHQVIGYALLLYGFYLSSSILFSDRSTVIILPLLTILVVIFQSINKIRYVLLLIVIHVSNLIYLLLVINTTVITISYGYYIYTISATLLMGFFLYQNNQLIMLHRKHDNDQVIDLTERNAELRAFNHQISESEATSTNRFKETNLLLNKYEVLSEKYHALIKATNHGLIDYDLSTKVLTFSDKACQLLDIQNHQVMDWSKVADRMPQSDRDHFSRIWSDLLDDLSTFEQIHIHYEHDDNRKSHLCFQFNRYTNNTLDKHHIVGLIKDVTVEMEQANRIAYLAFYDYMTDLPNRTKFLELFNDALKINRDNPCILCINIDNFKEFNSKNGFDNGNRMLRHIGEALKNTYDAAIVSRIYGNTFVIAMNYPGPIEDELLYIQSILDHLAILHFNVYNFSCSIGAVIIKSQQLNAEAYLNLSEEVMYQAKSTSKGSYLVITKETSK